MKIVISCCNRKNGGPFIHNGRMINFISQVDQVVPNDEMYFHPDDLVPNCRLPQSSSTLNLS
jgi:hypothetical protein